MYGFLAVFCAFIGPGELGPCVEIKTTTYSCVDQMIVAAPTIPPEYRPVFLSCIRLPPEVPKKSTPKPNPSLQFKDEKEEKRERI